MWHQDAAAIVDETNVKTEQNEPDDQTPAEDVQADIDMFAKVHGKSKWYYLPHRIRLEINKDLINSVI